MDERSERIAKRFDVPMLIAATLVIPTIIIEEAGPGEPLETLGVVFNYAVWMAFPLRVPVGAPTRDLLVQCLGFRW